MNAIELILNKIDELENENDSLWTELDREYVKGEREYYQDNHEKTFFNGYDGESISHVLDILDEENYILERLRNYINKLKQEECHIDKTQDL